MVTEPCSPLKCEMSYVERLKEARCDETLFAPRSIDPPTKLYRIHLVLLSRNYWGFPIWSSRVLKVVWNSSAAFSVPSTKAETEIGRFGKKAEIWKSSFCSEICKRVKKLDDQTPEAKLKTEVKVTPLSVTVRPCRIRKIRLEFPNSLHEELFSPI